MRLCFSNGATEATFVPNRVKNLSAAGEDCYNVTVREQSCNISESDFDWPHFVELCVLIILIDKHSLSSIEDHAMARCHDNDAVILIGLDLEPFLEFFDGTIDVWPLRVAGEFVRVIFAEVFVHPEFPLDLDDVFLAVVS